MAFNIALGILLSLYKKIQLKVGIIYLAFLIYIVFYYDTTISNRNFRGAYTILFGFLALTSFLILLIVMAFVTIFRINK